MNSKESRFPSPEDEPDFWTVSALWLEKMATSPPSQRQISRREFLGLSGRTVKENMPWVLFVGSLVGIIYLGATQLAKERDQPILTARMRRNLKSIPTGEKLLFWESGRIFSVYNISFTNTTKNLYLALNEDAFKDLLKEERINLRQAGRITFLVGSDPSSSGTSLGYRRAVLPVQEGSISKTGFLDEASWDISSGIGSLLLLGKDDQFWRSVVARQLYEREKLRILEKFDRQKIPPFSLWNRIPS